jgi:hypothetical protein
MTFRSPNPIQNHGSMHSPMLNSVAPWIAISKLAGASRSPAAGLKRRRLERK